MHRSHAHGVEAHQAEHRPIESLRLHYLADEESHSSLLLTVFVLLTTLYTGAGKTWGTWQSIVTTLLSLAAYVLTFNRPKRCSLPGREQKLLTWTREPESALKKLCPLHTPYPSPLDFLPTASPMLSSPSSGFSSSVLLFLVLMVGLRLVPSTRRKKKDRAFIRLSLKMLPSHPSHSLSLVGVLC